MAKTIKQIADELGIDKQKVYRYVKKNHINEVHHDAGVMHINDAVENAIKSHFRPKSASTEAHHEAHQTASNDAVNDAVIEMLRKELEIKNEQIRELNARLAESQKLLNQQQQLNAVVEQKLLLLEEKSPEAENKKWWQIWK